MNSREYIVFSKCFLAFYNNRTDKAMLDGSTLASDVGDAMGRKALYYTSDYLNVCQEIFDILLEKGDSVIDDLVEFVFDFTRGKTNDWQIFRKRYKEIRAKEYVTEVKSTSPSLFDRKVRCPPVTRKSRGSAITPRQERQARKMDDIQVSQLYLSFDTSTKDKVRKIVLADMKLLPKYELYLMASNIKGNKTSFVRFCEMVEVSSFREEERQLCSKIVEIGFNPNVHNYHIEPRIAKYKDQKEIDEETQAEWIEFINNVMCPIYRMPESVEKQMAYIELGERG